MKWILAIAASLALFFMVNDARAQTVVVTQPYIEFVGAVSANAIIREKRNGRNVESAQLDLCLENYTEHVWDRIVIDLKPEGDSFIGSGTTEIAKTKVAFRYSRKPKLDELNFIGTLTVGADTVLFESSRVSEAKEKEYQDGLYSIALIEQPADFTVISPQWVALRVARGKLPAVLEKLRGENVMLDSLNGLAEDCAVLRSGVQTIQFAVQPERLEALIARMKKTEGVLAAGWGGSSWMAYAVRLSAAAWSVNARPDRSRLEIELGKSVANTLQAELISTAWDPIKGDLVIKLKRASTKYRGLGLTEQIEVRLLVFYERPGNSGDVVIWALPSTAMLTDEGPGPRMKIQSVVDIGGEGIYVDQELVSKGIAQDLKGVTWNSELEKWNLSEQRAR